MINYQKVRDEVACVAIASFSPEIFHPSWFTKHNLISDAELGDDECKIDVIHQEMSRFGNSWLRFEALRDRIQISTTDFTRSDNLKDLLSSILSLLTESGCKQIGFNRILSYNLNAKDYHAVGNAFAPKKMWDNAFEGVDDDFGTVGLKSLEYRLNRSDSYKGHYLVKLFPSGPEEKPEITVRVNDHVEVRSDEDPALVIQEHWRDFENMSESLVNNILRSV
jgi:ribosomal protein S6